MTFMSPPLLFLDIYVDVIMLATSCGAYSSAGVMLKQSQGCYSMPSPPAWKDEEAIASEGSLSVSSVHLAAAGWWTGIPAYGKPRTAIQT